MKALLLVDFQHDFLPFGMQPYNGIEQLTARIKDLVSYHDLVVATQLWFPATHQRFASNHPWRHPGGEVEIDGIVQPLFEMYCIQNTMGSLLLKEVKSVVSDTVFQRGTNENEDIHSVFYDANQTSTGLLEYFKKEGITHFDLFGVDHLDTFEQSLKVGEEEGMKGNILI